MDKLNSQDKRIDKIIIVALTILVFMPGTLQIGSISYPMYFAAIVAVFAVLTKLHKNLSVIKENKWFVIANIIFASVFLILITVNTLRSGDAASLLSNFFEPVKILVYGVMILEILLICRDRENFIFALKVFTWVSTFVAIFGIIQYFNPFGINEYYVNFYAPGHGFTLAKGFDFPRIVGTKSNPNIFGAVMSLSLIISVVYYKYHKNKVVLLLNMSTQILALLYTFSRTSQVAMVAALVMFIFAYTLLSKGVKTTLKTIGILILVGIGLLIVLPHKLTFRFTEILNINTLDSWVARLGIWDDYILTIKDNFLIGIGPVKNYGLIVDSEWIQIILEYGIVGLFAYLNAFLMPLVVLIKKFAHKKDLVISSFIYLITAVIMLNVAGVSIINVEVSFILFMVMGLILALQYHDDFNNPGENIKTKKKKILVLAPYFPPMGGIGVFRATKLVKYLKKLGYTPVVISLTEDEFTSTDKSLMKNIDKDIKIYRIKPRKGILINDVGYRLYKTLKKEIGEIIRCEKPQYVIATGGPFLTLPIARFIYENFKIEYLLDLRDPWKLEKKHKISGFPGVKYEIYRKLSAIYEVYTFKKAKAITVVNETMAEDYIKEYPKYKDKIHVITNGYDEDDFKDIDQENYDKFTVVYSGKFDTAAGFRDPSNFFKAMKALIEKGHDMDFVHVGFKEDNIVNLAKEYGIEKHCKFLGFKTYEETLSYCKGASALLVIGGKEKYEQTGKIFDYIGVKKPVICICRLDGEISAVAKNVPYIDPIAKDDYDKLYKTLSEIVSCNKGINDMKLENNMYSRLEIAKKFITKLEQ
ncbi:MAG: glycosyltransferase [Clostridium sp.]|nr:glycosyltransferase [Clostridium sp.]